MILITSLAVHHVNSPHKARVSSRLMSLSLNPVSINVSLLPPTPFVSPERPAPRSLLVMSPVSLAVLRAPRGPSKLAGATTSPHDLSNLQPSRHARKWYSTGQPIPLVFVLMRVHVYYAGFGNGSKIHGLHQGNKISLSQRPRCILCSLSLPLSLAMPALNAGTAPLSRLGIVSLPQSYPKKVFSLTAMGINSTRLTYKTSGPVNDDGAKRHLPRADKSPCPSDISTHLGLNTTAAYTCQYKSSLHHESCQANLQTARFLKPSPGQHRALHETF
jgi:hypothetical protein